MDVRLLCVLCKWLSLRRADHSFSRVLPGCVCACARVCVCLIVSVHLIMCDLETSTMKWLSSEFGCCITEKNTIYIYIYSILFCGATVYIYIYIYKLKKYPSG